MPATSPRFTITVKPETYATLKRLALVQGRPAASIIREVLDGASETMDELATTIEALKAAQDAARADLTEGLAQASADLQPHLQGILEHLRAVTGLVSDPVESGRSDAARARGPIAQAPTASTPGL